MSRAVDETPGEETAVQATPGVPVSRRRFFELGAAWAVGVAAFAVAGCGGEDEGDEDEEEDD